MVSHVDYGDKRALDAQVILASGWCKILLRVSITQ
jgi:hypothetical protein